MSTKVKVVNLTGDVVLSTVEHHRSALLENFEENEIVLVSLSQTREIDLFGIQLLYAAKRYARRLGKEFHLTGAVPDDVSHRLWEAGFTDEVIHDGRELDNRLHEFLKGDPAHA
ncbi:MAG: STAS domain-containing protein [Spirochaetales bacterium]|nr:STAS domain-containing protein [Spirochaetales bacterium]